MAQIIRTNLFRKEFKLVMKRGKKESKFVEVLELLMKHKPLPLKYRDHNLSGKFKGTRELHIEPDWLLIYRFKGNELILERTGSHSDLFN